MEKVYADGTKAAKEHSPESVFGQTRAIACSVKMIDEGISVLEDRLDPILRPSGPESGNNNIPTIIASATTLGQELCGINRRLQELDARLRSLQVRIGL